MKEMIKIRLQIKQSSPCASYEGYRAMECKKLMLYDLDKEFHASDRVRISSSCDDSIIKELFSAAYRSISGNFTF